MIFKCRITLADTEQTNVNILYSSDSIKITSIEELGSGVRKYLVFLRQYKNYFHRRIRVWCKEVLVPV